MKFDIAKTASLLGMETVVESLLARTDTQGGRELVMAVRPAHDAGEAERLLDQTGAMLNLITGRRDFDIEPVGDIPGLLGKARKGRALSGAEIVSFAPLLRTAERIKIIFAAEGIGEESPIWTDMPAVHGLAGLIEESLDDEGNVIPTATPEIERLFETVNSMRRSIREKAEALIRDTSLASMLQDEFVTLRENRFVLPVRAEHKNHIEGIIHDSSNTGQTFFIEPKALVDLNNRLKTAEMELTAEIEKLLAELSGMIAEEADAIETMYVSVTRLDFIAGRARLARDYSMARPVFGERLDIKRAVNPMMAMEGKIAEPNDIALPEGKRILVISGPNTGGKTVALKTVGLLSSMAKTGLFITAAEGSRMPFYGDIFADIGDSQSITENLSTFSAHLTVINNILNRAGKGSLVLLDELMVSTDPKEGSALAVAALDRLAAMGADVVVTTHFGEIKTLAQFSPEYHNVSMEFDTLKMRPTYRMISGAPGASSAIAVAEKLGMDAGIISAARARLEGGDERIEKAMDELREQTQRLNKAAREAETLRAEADRLKVEAQKLKDELAAQKEELAKTAKRKISADVAAARGEISMLIEEARKAAGEKESLGKARERLEKIAAQARQAAAPDEVVRREELRAGDEIYVLPLEKKGTLDSDPADGKVEVTVGAMRVTVNLTDVIGVARAGKMKRKAPGRDRPVGHGIGGSDAAAETPELDIRGMRADDGIDELIKFLDVAYGGELRELRIIHGKGTGALRTAVREYLAGSPYIAEFRTGGPREGGDGVTVVKLRG
ncbi:MAG: endonuclease MutS2 [Nitrospinae bacterium]|nr:endonuclease MutS2 [Nitrospinota bacterium]